MIDFELSTVAKEVRKMAREFAENSYRPISRYYDEHEHEDIKEIEEIRGKSMVMMGRIGELIAEHGRPNDLTIIGMLMIEERYGGDAGLAAGADKVGVGNAVIGAVGTQEQKSEWGAKYAAMAISEPCCGSDTASIQMTAKLDKETNEWVLNGEKIFITGGSRCEIIVAWATLDRSMGRAAIKSFVIAKGTDGMTLTKLEHKMGFRASDTAAIVFEDCRIPFTNILGDPEVKPKSTSKTGFKGAMKTFDMTRPAVAAEGVGIGQAALDLTKQKLEEAGYTFPYDRSLHDLNTVQKSILEMEANIEAARLLVWRSASMLDTGQRNSLEASMAKAKAGRMATLVTQKCVEILGPIGYSRELLAEKFCRDSKIIDVFEGTGQINLLIIARNILGFNRDQLK